MSRCCSVGDNYPGIDHSHHCPLYMTCRIKELEGEVASLEGAARAVVVRFTPSPWDNSLDRAVKELAALLPPTVDN